MTQKIEEKLSAQDVLDVVQMASEIYSAGRALGLTTGSLTYTTPSLVNRNMNSLNNNPLIPTKEGLKRALMNYKDNADVLKAFSEFAEVWDMLYARTINYYTNLLAFNLDYVPMNIKDYSEYSSQEYKDDRKRVAKFLDNFDYKAEFRNVLKNILRNEIYYTWLRDSNGSISESGEIDINDDTSKKASKYTLQMMPQKYCLTTGKWEYGLLYDFNMSYFLQGGTSLASYDPIFRKYYRDTFGEDINNPNYNQNASIDKRTGTFANWTQTSPTKGAWAFKLDMSNYNETPFLSPLIGEVLETREIKALEGDANIAAAHGILAGEIPLLDKQKSGQVPDAMAFNPKTFTKFMKLVKAGLSDAVQAVGMPVENIHYYQFENNIDGAVEKQLKVQSGSGASATRIIYSDDRASQDELKAQISNDYQFVKRVYAQFENFLNYYINKKTKKYKFSFHLDGCTQPIISEVERKAKLDLADKGILLDITAYAGMVDMKPQDFERSLASGHYGGFSELLTQLISIHTASSSGRPQAQDGELTDAGETAREYD